MAQQRAIAASCCCSFGGMTTGDGWRRGLLDGGQSRREGDLVSAALNGGSAQQATSAALAAQAFLG